ncbi:MAG: DUF4261 domain-containing protein [Saprospiraceae bacterium]|nr:DUF4261 domain-containing protein [Saprospiraceae bacterium]
MRAPFAILLFSIYSFSPALLAQKPADPKVVTATVLLHSKTTPDEKALLQSLKNTWKVKVEGEKSADKTLVFNTSGGATVMIAYLDYPAAPDEVGAAARLSWLWQGAQTETGKHQAQVIISVIGTENQTLELYKILTQSVAATLENSRAAGVFMSSQYLLLSKDYFLAAARNMVQNQTIPLYCWVYFGRPGGSNGFTYGLQEFGMSELEIVNSARTEAEVHSTLYDAAMSLVKYNTRLQDGQAVTTEEGAKIPVKLAPGTHLTEQKVLKLEF